MHPNTEQQVIDHGPSALTPRQAYYHRSVPQVVSPLNGSSWLQQPHMIRAVPRITNQGCMEMFSSSMLGSVPLSSPSVFSAPTRETKNHFQPVTAQQGAADCPCGPALPLPSSLNPIDQPQVSEPQLQQATKKRTNVGVVQDHDFQTKKMAQDIGQGTIQSGVKKLRACKKKHEATLDGERRVAIEFESIGGLGALPQTYGKGALIVPDGVAGKYSAFGQRWKFTISHAVGPVTCEDGLQRMCLSWSVTNLNSGKTNSAVETPSDAMKRDRDGKTLCNRVFRDALSLRASALEEELRNTDDPSVCVDLQSQLRTIQTKRFSEGPLFFGLRHCVLQNEMKKAMEKRSCGKESI